MATHVLPHRSNPNLPHIQGMGMLPRSSSHPPDMFCWDEPVSRHSLTPHADKQSQTDDPIDMLTQFVIKNPRQVLLILGLDPDKILGVKSRGGEDVFTTNNPSNNGLNSKIVNKTTGTVISFQEWTRDRTRQQRFSAGDLEKNADPVFKAINTLPPSRSLKFNPCSWIPAMYVWFCYSIWDRRTVIASAFKLEAWQYNKINNKVYILSYKGEPIKHVFYYFHHSWWRLTIVRTWQMINVSL